MSLAQSAPSSSVARSLCDVARGFLATPQWGMEWRLSPEVPSLAVGCSPIRVTFRDRAIGGGGGGCAIRGARVPVWAEGASLAAGAGTGQAGPHLGVRIN